MKELSIEEKAKLYDELKVKAQELAEDGYIDKLALVDMFPELKESRDEMIRQLLISFVKYDMPDNYSDDFSKEDCLAWLEAQGEQKPVDKKQKFKVGDILVNKKGYTRQVVDIKDNCYYCTREECCDDYPWYGVIPYVDRCWHLWTIQDAKAGDVLATEGFVFIFKKIREDKCVGYFCANEKELHEGDDSTFHIANSNSLMGSINNDFTHYTPATKEQRNLLFQKMHEAGYEWDAEKLELNKIEQNPTEWKGEDYGIYKSIIDDAVDRDLVLTATQKEWIRNLKPQPKQEWSEEDNRMYNRIVSFIPQHLTAESYTACITWLKSLKDRYTWKPSEKQMEALDDFIYAKYPNVEKHGATVKSLYQDLKKLMEG